MSMQVIILGIFAIFLHLIKAGNGSAGCYKTPNYMHSDVKVGNANAFVDQLLANILKTHGHKLDPHPLPDKEFSFQHRVLLITYTGRAELYDGQLKGLCSLHRDGDCTMRNDEKGFRGVVNLAMNNLKYDYKGTVSFMGVGSTLEFYGTIRYVLVNMILKAKSGTVAKVERINIREMREIEVKIRNLPPMLNPLLKLLTDFVISLFKPTLKKIMESEVKVKVDEKLKDFNLILGL